METCMPAATDLGGLIDAIYDAGVDARRWPEVCARIAQCIGATHVNVSVLATHAAVSLECWDGIEASFAHSYADHYGEMDPIIPHLRRRAAGTLVTDTTIRPQTAHNQSEFVQEWVRPQHIYTVAFANVLCEDGAAGILGALRITRSFYSEGELDALRALLPHLRNAIRVQRHTADLAASGHGPGDALDALAHGVLLVDGDAHVIFANRVAEALLRAANGLRSNRDGLSARSLATTHTLRVLIGRAANGDAHLRSGGALLIERAPPDEPLQALISPLDTRHCPPDARSDGRGTAMLVLIDPQSSRRGVETRLVALFGLTPAEARVASEVGKGHHPRDIADTLQILPSTVRTHLHHVFAKTATRRQSELMRLMAQLAIMRGG
jgi:DNA-binding CsgD family transcriptional regulator/PAS domain-containing protein